MNDANIAKLCADIYNPAMWPDEPPDLNTIQGWRHFDTGDNDGICWGIVAAGDVDVVVFRGSVTMEDWLRDLDAWAKPWVHDELGPVHPGFMLGMEQVGRELVTMWRGKTIFAGHSLGAARATVLTALMLHAGYEQLGRVVFGEPKPGFRMLSDIVSEVPGRSYRTVGKPSPGATNSGHDLVTDLPFSFPPEEYMHPTPLINLPIEPPVASSWGPFLYHHMPLYAQALDRDAP